MAWIAIYRTADGVVEEVTETDPAFVSLSGRAYLPVPAGLLDKPVRVVSGKLVEDAAAVEAMLIADIKTEAERRKMLVMTSGGAKKAEYAEKRMEVARFDSLGGTVSAILAAVGLMSPDARASNFAHATASATARGEPSIALAIARFRAGMAASGVFPRIAAVEEKTVADIKAAQTAAAKRAAAAAVAWPT